jgi:hypothetical protein
MHPAVLRGSKKSRMRMKVPFTAMLNFPTLSPFLTVGKNKVGYFLDRPHISIDTSLVLLKVVDYEDRAVLKGSNICSKVNQKKL